MTLCVHFEGNSVVLESDVLRVVCEPHLGGKIRSFFSKRTGMEYLYQDLRQGLSGTEYSEHDISGLDECFPTVLPCEYPSEPWEGMSLGDHGLLWDRPWQTDVVNQKLIAGMVLDSMHIEFTRTAELIEPNALLLSYRIENRGHKPFEYLYAAHLMLHADSTTKIIYPREMDQAFVTVVVDNPVLHELTWTDWPPGEETLIHEPLLAERCTLAKLFSSKLQQGAAGVSHSDLDEQLFIEFSTQQLPYLGVLLAPGFGPMGKDGQSTLLALEPTSSMADDLQMARNTQTTQSIHAGQAIQFWLRLSLTTNDSQIAGGRAT